MAARIVVLGDINQDFVMRAERMPRPGETLTGSDLRLVPGGKCANQAVTAARLGAEVAVIGRLGSDSFGAELRENLREEGIETRWIEDDAEAATGAAFIALGPTGENSILVCMGANARISVEQVQGASEVIESADMLLVQLAAPLDVVLCAMQVASAAGTTVLLDPSPVLGGLSALWPLATVVVPNETEAEAIVGKPATSLSEARAAAGWFREKGVRTAIVTLGAAGALVADAAGARHVKGYAIEAVDTTGAGDAFAGALGTRLAEGASVDDALCFANAAGALAASRFGAQPSLPTRAEVDALMAQAPSAERIDPMR